MNRCNSGNPCDVVASTYIFTLAKRLVNVIVSRPGHEHYNVMRSVVVIKAQYQWHK